MKDRTTVTIILNGGNLFRNRFFSEPKPFPSEQDQFFSERGEFVSEWEPFLSERDWFDSTPALVGTHSQIYTC